jgi:hypothetical protein
MLRNRQDAVVNNTNLEQGAEICVSQSSLSDLFNDTFSAAIGCAESNSTMILNE